MILYVFGKVYGNDAFKVVDDSLFDIQKLDNMVTHGNIYKISLSDTPDFEIKPGDVCRPPDMVDKTLGDILLNNKLESYVTSTYTVDVECEEDDPNDPVGGKTITKIKQETRVRRKTMINTVTADWFTPCFADDGMTELDCAVCLNEEEEVKPLDLQEVINGVLLNVVNDNWQDFTVEANDGSAINITKELLPELLTKKARALPASNDIWVVAGRKEV